MNNTPRRTRPRRIPPSWEEEVSRQVGEMCRNGICRPSNSAWSSDVVLVRKKDGQMRFAIDYRQLNAVTKKDAYGPPNPQTILDKLEGNRYFSCLDIASAYWCIPMKESDITKTAFHTPRGLYEMLVMPFGMMNAGATFQRLMGQTLQGIKGAESYVDDILVFSRTFDEHLKSLRQVFRRLKVAEIQLRKDKCHLAYSECEFLGHRLTAQGRMPTQSYLEKLQLFPQPKKLQELQRFLGTLNYYRSYIPRMAEIAAPLYKLTKKGALWLWGSDCERDFELLRGKLVEKPVALAFPERKRPFYVETDASAGGVAAVLSQRDDRTGKLRPISYLSSSLSFSQKNYSAGQLEAWGIVSAARKWSVYLRAAPEVIFLTDHCPLQWLRSQKDPRHTYARWIVELEELPYRIENRPGIQNNPADYLSRLPNLRFDMEVNDEECFEGKIYSLEDPEVIGLEIVMKQGDNQVIQRAMQQIKTLGMVKDGQLRKVAQRLRVDRGALCFDSRLVVPKEIQANILEKVQIETHFRLVGTIYALRRNFFWAKMARDAKQFCRACIVCQRAKPSNRGKQPVEPVLLGKSYPGSAVGVDIGTLPWADDEYRYFILMVDLFTRQIELMPLHDQTYQSVVKAFEQGWVYRGHGVPEIVLTDQGSQLDGEDFRGFCKPLGIEKRHTTPYHPQCDGMAERNIGFVKQVTLCLMLDRQLSEVAFHCNCMPNASSKVSPFLLTYGRQPRSPIDAWCRGMEPNERNSHGEYLDLLQRKQAELNALARENIGRNLDRSRQRQNERRVSSGVTKGDFVMLRNDARHDSLDPRYDGPFEVTDRRGPDVKLDIRREVRDRTGRQQTRHRNKWAHLDRCKEYFSSPVEIVPSHSGEGVMTDGFEIERRSTEYDDDYHTEFGEKTDPTEYDDDYHTEFGEKTDLVVSEPVNSDIASDRYLGQEVENRTEVDNTVKE